MEEPSVLDYLKSIIAPWKYPKVVIPDGTSEGKPVYPPSERTEPISPPEQIQGEKPVSPSQTLGDQPGKKWFWLSIGALGLAIFAQLTLEPTPTRTWLPGFILYMLAFILVAISYIQGGIDLPDYKKLGFVYQPSTIRIVPFTAGIVLSIIAFLNFSGNRFTITNLILLTLSVAFLIWAFWVPEKGRLSIKISPWTGVIVGVFILAGFFRFYHLGQVPPEMNSDHAEKILDVMRVLDGQTMIFFPTNGGREALQFYLVAGLHKIFNINLDFMILKIVTVAAGFLSLPFIYLLGKDLVNKRVGIIALAFAGVAYWPNIVSRVGLRLPFYILFTAATLYFLLKGLQTGRRNYFLLCGVTLGLGLHGYSANRILPLIVFTAVIIFIIHNRSSQKRHQVIISTLLLFVIAGVIFIPLFRFMLEDPDSFLFRMLTRIGPMERELTDPAMLLFFRNMVKSLTMVSWDNGEIWPVSIPHRPALDVITAALFWLGVLLLIVRYIRKRNWLDIFWLISIPLLMLPSIMSLAFPAENPNLYRSGGAMVPVFMIIAFSLDGMTMSIRSRFGSLGPSFAWALALLLVTLSAFQSYNLVFKEYYNQYKASAWNSSEMGAVVKDFAGNTGGVENIWVMGYPHWVDTRLIGMIAGYPTKNYVLFPEDIEDLPENPDPKLFLIKPEDEAPIATLKTAYPYGWIETFTSETAYKDFLMFFVPPTDTP